MFKSRKLIALAHCKDMHVSALYGIVLSLRVCRFSEATPTLDNEEFFTGVQGNRVL